MGYISLANRDPLFPWWHKIQIMTKPRFYVTGCLVSGLATIVAAAPCTLCADGSPLTKPNATLDSLAEEFGFVPTCSIVQAELDLVSADSSQCSETQLLGSYCGCPRVDDYCRACEDPPESFSEQNLPHFRDHFGYDLSCKQASMVMSQLESDSQMCRVMSDHIWLCGCNGGNKQYYGANTREEKALLAWLPRVASIFSIMGSSFIFRDVIRDKKKQKSTFHQILFAMSIFDVLSSIGWGLTTIPINRYDDYGYPTHVFGARGNQRTCTAQGFFVQLGFTGALYNLTLSLYYTLVIAFGWTETKLRRVRLWFHTPILIGLALACAGIPFYRNDLWGCYIPPPPIASSYREIAIFYFVPVILVVVVATANIAVVVWTVRKHARKVKKWRKGGKKGAELEQKVMWQALFYLAGFYLSYPFLLGAHMDNAAMTDKYWLFLTFITLAPLQGFTNFLVYTRPRISRYMRRKQKEREQRHQQEESGQERQESEELPQQQGEPESQEASKGSGVPTRLDLVKHQTKPSQSRRTRSLPINFSSKISSWVLHEEEKIRTGEDDDLEMQITSIEFKAVVSQDYSEDCESNSNLEEDEVGTN